MKLTKVLSFPMTYSSVFQKKRVEMAFSRRIRINLIQEAKTELDFLALVDDYPSLYAGPVLKNAIRRYEFFWLPLAARQGMDSRLLAAPLDIAWVWHLHMLSPQEYEQDCLNIVTKVVDHAPMNRQQRQKGLQQARYLWEKAYPKERFEVSLNEATPFSTPYLSKIRCDIEKASHYQSKFYYQVSLPHFDDTKFLASAIERYEHHLQLKTQHPDVPLVPCIDVELIWHAHLHHPLNYQQDTTDNFGAILNPENHEGSSSLGYTGLDSEAGTRAVWSAAGFQFDKLGTVYRGEPPQPRPMRADGFYTSLGRLQYVMNILKVEVINVDVTKIFFVRLYNSAGTLILEQAIKGGTRVDVKKQCFLDNEKLHTITVTLHQQLQFGERVIGSAETSLLSYLDSCPYGGTIPKLPWVIDVPLTAARRVVRLLTKLDPPIIEGYRFKVLPQEFFTRVDNPSLVLSFPQSMISPSDVVKSYLPCESATHTLQDYRGREAFKCRVVHSTAGLLSAVEIISLHGIVVASAHVINPNILPDKGSIEDHKSCVYLNHTEGERAMLIRSRKDWGICIGKWQRGKVLNRGAGHVEITLFKLDDASVMNKTSGWCEVRKYRGGLYMICLDTGVFVYVDLKRGLFVMSPTAHDIPEIIALAFSVSILYLLCKPYNPTPANESSPSFHKKAGKDKVTPMLLAAGYKSSMVPTNVHLLRRTLGPSATGPSIDGAGSYDLDSEYGNDWTRELQLEKVEAHLWLSMNEIPFQVESKNGSGVSGSRNDGGAPGSRNGGGVPGSRNGGGIPGSRNGGGVPGSRNGGGVTGSKHGSGVTGSKHGSGVSGRSRGGFGGRGGDFGGERNGDRGGGSSGGSWGGFGGGSFDFGGGDHDSGGGCGGGGGGCDY